MKPKDPICGAMLYRNRRRSRRTSTDHPVLTCEASASTTKQDER